jgi:uncharacterized protein YigA (DUF484 family)
MLFHTYRWHRVAVKFDSFAYHLSVFKTHLQDSGYFLPKLVAYEQHDVMYTIQLKSRQQIRLIVCETEDPEKFQNGMHTFFFKESVTF